MSLEKKGTGSLNLVYLMALKHQVDSRTSKVKTSNEYKALEALESLWLDVLQLTRKAKATGECGRLCVSHDYFHVII